MKHYKILVLFILLSATSCSPTKLIKSNVSPEEVTNLLFIEPFSFIYYISSGNTSDLNDSLSAIRDHMVYDLFHTYHNELHITGEITLEDTLTGQKVMDELGSLMGRAYRYGNLYYMKPAPVIDSLLRSEGHRFGLFVLSKGFIRKRGNFPREKARADLKNAIPYKFEIEHVAPRKSALFVLIYDAGKHEVAFFGNSVKEEPPLNEDLLRKRFKELFRGYFFK
ncbi:MAG: hypothetical protein NTX61_08620 [Bacteroidetes bacterium]|nr:hypothetical protein [Bacteroidota bacterium]